LYFDGSGQFTTSSQPNSRYKVNVTWNPLPPTGMQWADVKVTWPAAATAANATGSTEIFAACDRN
jgi:hypothetical protein